MDQVTTATTAHAESARLRAGSLPSSPMLPPRRQPLRTDLLEPFPSLAVQSPGGHLIPAECPPSPTLSAASGSTSTSAAAVAAATAAAMAASASNRGRAKTIPISMMSAAAHAASVASATAGSSSSDSDDVLVMHSVAPSSTSSRRRRATTVDQKNATANAALLAPMPAGAILPEIPLVAKQSKNAAFHALFKHLPPDEYLIEDFACALQKEILVQGRLYLTTKHLCFHSVIFGWVTSLVIPWAEMAALEKRSTALIFPNAIEVATSAQKYLFASFLFRELAYNLMAALWRKQCPNAPPLVLPPTTPNASETDDDSSRRRRRHRFPTFHRRSRRHNRDADPNETLAAAGASISVDDDDELDDLMESTSLPISRAESCESTAAGSSAHGIDAARPLLPPRRATVSSTGSGSDAASLRRAREAYAANDGGWGWDDRPPAPAELGTVIEDSSVVAAPAGVRTARAQSDSSLCPPPNAVHDAQSLRNALSSADLDQPGPTPGAVPAATCRCRHYPTPVLSTTWPNLTPAQAFAYLYEDKDAFMTRFMTGSENECVDFVLPPWCDSGRTAKYTMPLKLNVPMAPKSTPVITTEELAAPRNPNACLAVHTATSTPVVPSGSAFNVHIRVCFLPAPNGTKVTVSVKVEWVKSCWIKSAIESGVVDGQKRHWKILDARVRELAATLKPSSKPPSITASSTKSADKPLPATPPPALPPARNSAVAVAAAQPLPTPPPSTAASAVGASRPCFPTRSASLARRANGLARADTAHVAILAVLVCANVWMMLQLRALHAAVVALGSAGVV
ncbi:hypothetical protein AMAG_16335 [Allomyces macrogynus ATCC 38327]|uniref:VASt domain-containing protein n=1 Tax=Allomyces macrogynus (strain ATCC 38327) TaxID=578462 RepID=A0A0L0TBF5_ALLM3|nr:hypothetical protein AMAG_16335 [Allomyces macrogynus ATCC 38327]|eukprot:KNE71909.1 hypothetical protein AMAG_16335 [Allomyces macrogynus ATCC 38327]